MQLLLLCDLEQKKINKNYNKSAKFIFDTVVLTFLIFNTDSKIKIMSWPIGDYF